MAGLPEVTVAGTLVADPELKFFDSGSCVANFTIAANDRRFDREQGTWVDGDATFLRCSIWRQAAENVVQSLNKGNRVLVTGTLRQRSWETEAGDKRTTVELAVTEIGASLKFATASVTKAARTGDKPADGGPWNSTSPTGSEAKTAADEPPF